MAYTTTFPQTNVLIDGTTASASITSSTYHTKDAGSVGIHCYSSNSGDRAGTITVQGTGDPSKTQWFNIAFHKYSDGSTSSSLTVTASTELNEGLGIPMFEFPYLRVVFTRSGGSTGALYVWAFQKKAPSRF